MNTSQGLCYKNVWCMIVRWTIHDIFVHINSFPKIQQNFGTFCEPIYVHEIVTYGPSHNCACHIHVYIIQMHSLISASFFVKRLCTIRYEITIFCVMFPFPCCMHKSVNTPICTSKIGVMYINLQGLCSFRRKLGKCKKNKPLVIASQFTGYAAWVVLNP